MMLLLTLIVWPTARDDPDKCPPFVMHNRNGGYEGLSLK